jgi:hypothetical protein
MKKKNKLWLIFVAVFIAGILLGMGGGYMMSKQRGKGSFRLDRGVIKKRFISDLGKSVQLNDTQKNEISNIMDQHFKKIRAFHMQNMPKMKELKNKFFADVQAQLRPEQLAGFEAFKKYFQARVRRHKSKMDNMQRHPGNRKFKGEWRRRRRVNERGEKGEYVRDRMPGELKNENIVKDKIVEEKHEEM